MKKRCVRPSKTTVALSVVVCALFYFPWCVAGEMSHWSLSPLSSLLLGQSLPADVWRMLGQAVLEHLLERDLQRFLSCFPLGIQEDK